MGTVLVDFTGPRDCETELRETRYELLDWLIGHAVALEYADNAVSYGESAASAAAAATADGSSAGMKCTNLTVRSCQERATCSLVEDTALVTCCSENKPGAMTELLLTSFVCTFSHQCVNRILVGAPFELSRSDLDDLASLLKLPPHADDAVLLRAVANVLVTRFSPSAVAAAAVAKGEARNEVSSFLGWLVVDALLCHFLAHLFKSKRTLFCFAVD